MLKVFIQGLKDGEYNFELNVPVSKVPDMFEEFFGDITVDVQLKKWGKRYSMIAQAKCQAKLQCDISLEEYVETISAEIKVSFLANTDLYWLQKDGNKNDELQAEDRIIHEDEKELDISDEVREELLVNMPMKRLAPAYRDKTFDELHPEIQSKASKKTNKKKKDENIDARWNILKTIKIH